MRVILREPCFLYLLNCVQKVDLSYCCGCGRIYLFLLGLYVTPCESSVGHVLNLLDWNYVIFGAFRAWEQLNNDTAVLFVTFY